MRIKGDTITFGFITLLFIAAMVGIGYAWHITFTESISYIAENCRSASIWKPLHHCSDQTLYTLTIILLTIVSIVFSFVAIVSFCITIKTMQKHPYDLELVEIKDNE